MSEIITTYKLDDLDQAVPMDRDEFYDEQIRVFKETGKPSRAAAVVQVLLFSPDHDLILQKRSSRKNHNPSFLDKSMGGHIKFGNSPNYTVMVETLEELNVPSIVIADTEEFKKTYKLLENFVSTSAIVQFVESRTYNSEKIINKEKVIIANKYYFYLGVYNGAMKPSDREAAGLIFTPYDQLQEEIDLSPDFYTADLKFFLEKYNKIIDKFLTILS